MKKTRIAVGVVIALGVIWTGGAWFTGKQLEKNMDQLVQQANAALNQTVPGSHLQLSYQDYQRGLFSSSVRLVLQSSSQTEDNSLLKPGQSIVLKETIDHGPFPLAQLKKLNLMPGMASIHSELENTVPVKPLFDLTGGASILQAETRVDYSKATSSDIHLLPVSYADTDSRKKLDFKGGILSVQADSKGDKISMTGDIDSLTLTTQNPFDMAVQFTLNGVKLDSTSHLSPDGLRIGDQNLAIKSILGSVDGKESLTLEDLIGKTVLDAKDSRVSALADYSFGKLKLQGQDFGHSKLHIALSDLDSKAVQQFATQYNNQILMLAADPALQNNPDLYQQQMSEFLATNLPLLLKGGPSFSIEPLSWANDKGESRFDFTVKFKDPATITPETTPKTLTQQLDNLLTSVDAKLNISTEMATEMMTHEALATGKNQEQAAQQAEQQVKSLATMGQMFNLTTQQDKNILSAIQYADGQITINGEKMPLEQFLSRYMQGIQ